MNAPRWRLTLRDAEDGQEVLMWTGRITEAAEINLRPGTWDYLPMRLRWGDPFEVLKCCFNMHRNHHRKQVEWASRKA